MKTDSEDVGKLGWLQESVSFRDGSVLSNSLAGQIEGKRTSQLTDEQRNLKIVPERIQKGVELFTNSIERSKRGDFVDARKDTEV